MKFSSVQSVLAFAVSLNLALGYAASPGIGTVTSPGAFRLDRATVISNGTLFEGSLIETGTASSSVQVSNGARLSLTADSRGRIFGDRLVLEKGSGTLENSIGFKLVALGLTIQPERANSTGNIVIENRNRIQVRSSSGALRVLNANGQLVANLSAGSALAFEPQGGPSNATRVLGCLEQKAEHYLVTDEVTNVTVEVAGSGVANEAGNRVEITGTLDPAATPSGKATQLVRVREVRRVTKGCGSSAAAAGGAKGPGISGAATGTIAIIGGVAAAAVLGGLAAADALPGQATNASSR